MSKWGTVKEPRKVGRYLVTIETEMGRQVRQADRYIGHWGGFAWYILPNGDNSKVVAWQKCPKPYYDDKNK